MSDIGFIRRSRILQQSDVQFAIATAASTGTTWNPLDIGNGITLSNGNLDALKLSSDATWESVRATTTRSTGKYYYEIKRTGAGFSAYALGIAQLGGSLHNLIGSLGTGSAGYQSGGLQVSETPFTSNGALAGLSYNLGDRIDLAVDFDAGKLFIGENNNYSAFFTGQNPVTGANPPWSFTPNLTLTPCLSLLGNGTGDVSVTLQATTASFTDGAPSGFLAWGT